MFEPITIYLTSALTAALCVILTTFFTGVMAMGLWYTHRSLAEAEKSRKVSAWQTLLQTWGETKSRNARRYIFTKLNYSSIKDLTDEERDFIEDTLASCNRISYMVISGLIREEDVLYFIGRSMLHVWEKLIVFVNGRRKQAGEDPADNDPYNYMTYFQKFITKYKPRLENKHISFE